MVQTSIGNSDVAYGGNEPMYQDDENGVEAEEEAATRPRRKGASEAVGSSNSKSQDEMPRLKALIQRIVKEGNRAAGENEVSKAGTNDEPVDALSSMIYRQEILAARKDAQESQPVCDEIALSTMVESKGRYYS